MVINKLSSIIVHFLCGCSHLDCSLVTGPDEGGGATVGLQPSETLLASEEDVVEGGWAPTNSHVLRLVENLVCITMIHGKHNTVVL